MPREREALLRVGQPRRHRAVPSLAVRPPPAAERPGLNAVPPRRSKWYVAPLVLVLVGAAGLPVVVQEERSPARTSSRDATPVVTPVLSARRAPAQLAAPVPDRRLTPPYVQHFKHQPVVHSSLEELADRIKAAGVGHIEGSVVGDDARFDTQRYLPQWPARFASLGEIGPMSALLVNDGLAEFPP